MARLSSTESQPLSPAEIDQRIAEFRKELVKLNAQRATGTIPKKPSDIKNVRKNIAHLLTIKKTKEGKQKHE